jgi:hypothetical protein
MGSQPTMTAKAGSQYQVLRGGSRTGEGPSGIKMARGGRAASPHHHTSAAINHKPQHPTPTACPLWPESPERVAGRSLPRGFDLSLGSWVVSWLLGAVGLAAGRRRRWRMEDGRTEGRRRTEGRPTARSPHPTATAAHSPPPQPPRTPVPPPRCYFLRTTATTQFAQARQKQYKQPGEIEGATRPGRRAPLGYPPHAPNRGSQAL